MIKPGDRVIVQDASSKHGLEAVVVVWSKPHGRWAVEFEDRTAGGHGCEGAVPSGFGWYVDEKYMVAISAETPLEQSVREYIRQQRCSA